jgi:putative ABC transport system ATP-binding protein
MPSSSSLLSFDQVTVNIQGKILLNNISFSLNDGEKIGLCGQSGSGKSTVLKTALGLYPLEKGTVYFQEHPLSSDNINLIRSNIAYIGQEPVLAADTVRNALFLPFQFKTHRDRHPTESELIEALKRLSLPKTILNQTCDSLSGGEKQRVALARGLLLGKNLYFLDEATSALDAKSKQAVLEVFTDQALTVLSVAHDAEWLTCCDHVLQMEHGQMFNKEPTGFK